MKKHVVIGITSGIAAFKALDFIHMLQKEDIEIDVIMTEKATHMINVDDVEKILHKKVFTTLFEDSFNYQAVLQKRTVDHIDVADKANVFVILPATANTIAKLAHGIADDFLSTSLLATTAPVIFCPAMNIHMWSNPLVQKNIQTLQQLGFQCIKPAKGMLACGYEGVGRLEDLNVIKDAVVEQLARTNSLHGKKILVTAGGTIEPIDDVRFMTNKSSGKMGIALAEECKMRGAEVLLLRAKSAVVPRFSIPELMFETADDLHDLIKQHIKDYDIMFHVAAVSDFYLSAIESSEKKTKLDSKKKHTLSLTPRAKIIDMIKKLHPTIRLIGFKAESNLSPKELITKAQKRLEESGADWIVANDVGKPTQGFGAEMNEVFILEKNSKELISIPLASKKEVAKQVIEATLTDILKDLKN